jgi:hypothetical protein
MHDALKLRTADVTQYYRRVSSDDRWWARPATAPTDPDAIYMAISTRDISSHDVHIIPLQNVI